MTLEEIAKKPVTVGGFCLGVSSRSPRPHGLGNPTPTETGNFFGEKRSGNGHD